VYTQPDDLTEPALARALSHGWHLGAESLVYVPIGFGSHHWKVDEGGRRWFVTVDDLDAKVKSESDTRNAAFARLGAALTAARRLADQGLDFVVAPIAAADGSVLLRIDDRYAAAVYPYVDGTSYPYGDFQALDHRHAVLAMLARLHGVSEPAATGAATDDLVVPQRQELSAAIDELASPWKAGPFGEAARQLLGRHATGVHRLFQHYDVIAAAVSRNPQRIVLTHGEPHPANTLRTAHGWLLVDWDTTLLAAPERDLWSMAAADPTVVDTYQAMTGRQLDRQGLDCYRLGWDLAEICGYIAVLRHRHEDSADMRASWSNLQHCLDPAARWPQFV
jgi:spectinomycin phosphotransferase/16S rRNA (guanine(1405)-N(7))-methyltransferase